MLTYAAILLAGTMVVGQAKEPGPNYEHLKAMEWLAGTWVTEETKLEQDIADVGKKGDTLAMVLSFNWDLDKNVLAMQFDMKVNGIKVYTSRGMYGWDRKAEKVVGFSFGTRGGRGDFVLTPGDGMVRMAGRSLLPDGKIEEATATLKQLDSDAMTSERTDIKIDGVAQPDRTTIDWKKVTKAL